MSATALPAMFSCSLDDDSQLVPQRVEDAATIFAAIDANRAHLRTWLPWVDGTKSPEDTRAFLEAVCPRAERGECLQASILHQGRFVGSIGLHAIDRVNNRTSVGYWLADQAQGKGLATKACRAIMQHVFEELKLNRFELRAAVDNYKSRAIAERLGMQLEGIARQWEKLNTSYVDMAVYSLLAEEWQG